MNTNSPHINPHIRRALVEQLGLADSTPDQSAAIDRIVVRLESAMVRELLHLPAYRPLRG
ncbi:hypothetical protein [Rhodococcus sp. NPDC049939]|uniref:hypothetical protein n=1 Tax=Rhodococcus sp. NPDC049939 TaxID=3155511 RepID=UPI003404930B